MRSIYLMALILIVGGMAPVSGRGPRGEICSVKMVVLGGDLATSNFPHHVETADGQMLEVPNSMYPEAKKIIEEDSWLRVIGTTGDYGDWTDGNLREGGISKELIRLHGPVGTLSWESLEGGIEAQSSPGQSRIGSQTYMSLVLKDSRGKVVWSIRRRGFEGVVGWSDNVGDGGAYETSGPQWDRSLRYMVRKLSKVGCGP